MFKNMDSAALKELQTLVLDKNFPKNTELFDTDTGNKLYILKKGKVVLYHLTQSGKKTIITEFEPGSIFGRVTCKEECDYFATTLEDSYVCTIDKEKFFEFASRHPQLAQALFSSLMDKIADSEDKIAILAADSAVQKFKKLVRFLIKKHGEKTKSGLFTIKAKFTHEELAEMMGITRQTTTTIINKLEKEGAIKRSGKTLIVDEKKMATN